MMEINTQLCPDCGCPLDHLSTFGDGPQAYRICPVCNPAKEEHAEEQRMRAQEMAQEMERGGDSE